MLSAVVLCYHVRPEAGPGVDQLKTGLLDDGPSLKKRSIQKLITSAAVDNDKKFVHSQTEGMIGDRL